MQGNNVGNEFKAVAQDVMQLGARCVQAGREWLTERRNEMTNRNEQYGQEQGYNQPRNQGQAPGSRQTPGQQYGTGEYNADQYGSNPYASSQYASDQHLSGQYQPRQSGEHQSGRFQSGRHQYGQPSGQSQSGQHQYGQQAYGQQAYGQQASGQYGSGGYQPGEYQSSQWDRQQPQGQRQGSGSASYTQGSQGYGAYQGRQSGEGYGSSSGYGNPQQDSYDDTAGYRSQTFATPGDTQPRYGAEVRRQSYAGRGPRNYTRSDERITEDLCERLTQDHDIDASDVEVKVANGTATLEGAVPQRWMKHRAEDLADGCSGVRTVENRLRVQSSASTGSSMGSEAQGNATRSGTSSKATGSAGQNNLPGSTAH